MSRFWNDLRRQNSATRRQQNKSLMSLTDRQQNVAEDSPDVISKAD